MDSGQPIRLLVEKSLKVGGELLNVLDETGVGINDQVRDRSLLGNDIRLVGRDHPIMGSIGHQHSRRSFLT